MAQNLKWKLIMIGFLRIKRWISSFSKFWTSLTLDFAECVPCRPLKSRRHSNKGCLCMTYILRFRFWCSRRVCWVFGGVAHKRNFRTSGSLSSGKTKAYFVPRKSWNENKRDMIIHHSLERIVWTVWIIFKEVDNEEKGFPIGPDHVIMHRNGVGLILPLFYFF